METPSQDLKKQKQREYHRQWAAKNRERCNAAQARFRERHGERLIVERQEKWKAQWAAMTPEQKDEFRRVQAQKTRARYYRDRDAAYAAYGGRRCNCCGETQPMFLSIDHVHNNRRQMEEQGLHGKDAQTFYRYLRRTGYPSGFQVLCMNCQVGKHKNKGVCPHQVRCND